MKLTLKSQLNLFLLSFVILLIVQLIFTRANQHQLLRSFSSYQVAVSEEKIVRELERDVLDLQRHVLVFKDTGSLSSKARFDSIIADVKISLTSLLENLPDGLNTSDVESTIEAMQQHLIDYEENFSSVVVGRTDRDSIFEQGVLLTLNQLINDANVSYQSQEQLQQNQFSYYLSLAENKAYQYLLTPNSVLKTEFIRQVENAEKVVDNLPLPTQQKSNILTKLSDVKDQFTQLALSTTGYLYLVNVVMAGSANEFLFLAKELSETTGVYATKENASISASIDESRQRLNVYMGIALFTSLLIAFFIARRIIRPMAQITSVFEKLSDGKNITEIPGEQRRDEIGQLAEAAKVFNNKNKQTEALLREAQSANDQSNELNKQLQDAIRVADQANASKSIFLANMSHEIRTPMNAIIGLVDLSMREELNENVRNNLSKILYSSQILTNVINDILDFSKIEAGKLEIEESYFSFASLFDTLLAVASLKASEKNLNLRLYVEPSLPTNAIGDPLRISQVLLNLLSNAIKFTRSGVVDIRLSSAVSNKANAFKLVVQVIDTGIGMSEAQLNKIFMPFIQADGSTSREFGGTGLGLTIVKQLVKLMDGEISASSEEGKGSTFECSFTLLNEKEPHQLLAEKNQYESAIHYVCCDGDVSSYIEADYLKQVSTSLNFLQHHDFPELVSSITQATNTLIIIDIEHGKQARALHDYIAILKAKKLRYACVTNTQPLQLKTLLQAQWQCPVLSHPFTPTEFYAFVATAYDDSTPFTAKSHDVEEANTLISAISTTLYEGHVLLVEDNSINQAVAGEMLHSFGLTYDVAEDGHQALTKVTNSPYYDLILMDIQMPVMDGKKATKAIRALGLQDIPIIGLSANAMKEDYKSAKESGMDDYLTKPIRRETLRQAIEKYLLKQS
ncbi:response regulator [Glaciecola sp. MH2013]|uniref:hybrid sensor histidine kinase/response regulator n=1 Tax=Glaciecola sp. MH2013 TaxID=2785524 RepID=UPI00189EDA56|nr:hybrid sensor histidine kinase/response regulator [Glaciecola sp. MH2013]MBF7074537.1 response regulator [Glaciecola sp. MH2013]